MLLLIPGVRECSEVRNFLAPQALGPPPIDGGVVDRTPISPMESSVESLSNLPVNGSPRKLTTVPEQMSTSDGDSRSTTAKTNEYAELTPITIPIFDMMIELFDLHHGNNWPRKALIDAVQRLLGGRIERYSNLNPAYFRIVRDQVSKYLVESYIVDIMKQLQEAIWPNGVLRKNPPARTTKEKTKTKRDAGFKLATIFEGLPQKCTLVNSRFSRKYHGPWKCSIWSNTIGIVVSKYPFEYPFCIYCIRRGDSDFVP